MNEADIRRYANLMKELELTGLELTEGDKVVRLERSIPATVFQSQAVPEQLISMAQNAEALTSDGRNVGAGAAGNPKESYVSVKSPMVGVFYAAPAENASPYVAIGDHVSKGQTLCIIEAMKLMNEITAEEDGVISEICVTDGQVIEYGTELFRIIK